MTLDFTVYGVALPKGNMRAIQIKGMKFPIVTESNKSVKSWSQLVAQGASAAMQAQPDATRGVLVDGVRLTVAFYLPRPKSIAKKGVVTHIKKPDCTKLVRAVEDALTKVVYTDDSQVVEIIASKHYARLDDAPHVRIRVEPSSGVVEPKAQPLFDDGPRPMQPLGF